jgi:hypothetical protein
VTEVVSHVFAANIVLSALAVASANVTSVALQLLFLTGGVLLVTIVLHRFSLKRQPLNA